MRATELLAEFSNGKSFTDYLADAMLRSAVERQFEIIGEALNSLSKVDQALAASIPDLPRIVAFRKITQRRRSGTTVPRVHEVVAERLAEIEDLCRAPGVRHLLRAEGKAGADPHPAPAGLCREFTHNDIHGRTSPLGTPLDRNAELLACVR